MAEAMNRLGAAGTPFLFIIDFEMERPLVIPLADVDPRELRYSINGKTNYDGAIREPSMRFPVSLASRPMAYDRYREMFDLAVARQARGDSYLLNLTFPTEIEIDRSLEEIFVASRARYRLWMRDRLVVFSPESFVRIEGREISSYPMKGTIDASVPGAVEKVLLDEKELAEHCTIVDLIRNDLNMVSSCVTVDKYRYIEKVRSPHRDLYQVSSRIRGNLEEGYRERIGSIIAALLPAGSISGAPKRMTLEIIREVEGYRRGYYTGVMGYFDGNVLDSGVMIRYIERIDGKLYYKSGGGITVYSDPGREYRELLEKIYVPVA
ncbi:MAG: aminodeoxychorismate synthase component I [Spirochaetes bacterium]|nr:aminodeoxychorismate synthase component I [Spirochaetota bacterium]